MTISLHQCITLLQQKQYYVPCGSHTVTTTEQKTAMGGEGADLQKEQIGLGAGGGGTAPKFLFFCNSGKVSSWRSYSSLL